MTRTVFLVDPDGTVRDYPEGHYHVRAARDGLVLSGELARGNNLPDREYRFATAEEVAEVLSDHVGVATADHADLASES